MKSEQVNWKIFEERLKKENMKDKEMESRVRKARSIMYNF